MLISYTLLNCSFFARNERTQNAFIEEILDWHVPYRVLIYCVLQQVMFCYSNRALYGSDNQSCFLSVELKKLAAFLFWTNMQCGRLTSNYRSPLRDKPRIAEHLLGPKCHVNFSSGPQTSTLRYTTNSAFCSALSRG